MSEPIIIAYYSTIARKITKRYIITSGHNKTVSELSKEYGKWVNINDNELLSMFEVSATFKGGSEEEGNDFLFTNTGDVDLFENLESMLQGIEEEKETAKLGTVSHTTIKPAFHGDGHTVVTNEISIYPFDRIYDLALKIGIITKIPYYRLHLDYIGKDGHVYGTYKLYAGGPYDTSIVGYGHNSIDLGDGIYVDKYIHDIKADTKVYSTDNFSVCEGIRYVIISDLNELVARMGGMISDQYSMDLVYYGLVMKYYPQVTVEVFRDYIENESKMSNKYPELAREYNYIKSQYDSERKLLRGIENERNMKDLLFSIIRCTVSGVGPGPLNLRNIFDTLTTNDPNSRVHIPEIHFFLKDGAKNIQFSKVHHGVRSRGVPNQQVLRVGLTVIIIRHSDVMYLTLHPNGRWYFKTVFPEEEFMNFDKVTSFVTQTIGPIIKSINNIGIKGSPSGPISLSGMEYDHISAGLFWKKILTDNQFKELIKTIDTYVSAGILGQYDIVNTVKDSQLYIFKKGTYEFDGTLIDRVLVKAGRGEIKNQFSYLVNPVIRTKWMELYSGRVIRIIHRASDIFIEIQDAQQNEFELFRKIIIHALSFSGIKEMAITSVKSNLDKSKEQDPILFNLKKAGYPVVYARICQKKMQPIVYQESEYGVLSDNVKRKLVKYKNFTYNRPAYYMCPGNTYKYLNFIAGVHPAGYCLPCCFKTPVSDREKKAKQIFESCTTKFKGPDDIISESRHVLATNKVLDPGRIGHMPESAKKILPKGLYSLGVPQYVRALFCPMLSIGASVIQEIRGKFIPRTMDPVDYFIDDLYAKLKAKGKMFIPDLDPDDLFNTLGRVNRLQNDSVDWNSVLTRALLVFYGITVVFFTDSDIDIPAKGSVTDKMVFVIKRNFTKESSVNNAGPAWYPVCQISDDYFKTSKIGKIVFSLSEELEILQEALEHYDLMQESNVNKKPGAEAIIEWLHLQKNDYIKYVGRKNKVYAIGILTGEYSGLTIPVEYSDYASGKEKVSFDPVSTDNNPGLLKRFFDSFELKGYIKFDVTNVFARGDMYVGVLVNGLHCSHSPESAGLFVRPEWNRKTRIIEVDYDILEVNRLLIAGNNRLGGNLLAMALYKYHLYDLVLMQVTNELGKRFNHEIRQRIVLAFSNKNNTYIQALKLLSDIMPRGSDDFEKMVGVIGKYKGNNRAELLELIIAERYSWDKKYTESFYTIEGVTETMEATCQRGTLSINDFPNVYEPCTNSAVAGYCEHGRLIVDCDNKFWESLPGLIVDDLNNPIKKEYLVDRLYYDNIIDQFSYKVSPNETLFIKKK